MDKQLQNQIDEYLGKFSKSGHRYQLIFKQLIKSPHCEAWKILESVLDEIQTNEEAEYFRALKFLEDNIQTVKSFTMLIFLYVLSRQNKTLFRRVYWKAQYIQIGLDGGQITIFSTWVSLEPNSKIVQDSLWLAVSAFPYLLHDQYIEMSEVQLNSALEWVTFLQTTDSQKYTGVCQLVKMAKQTKMYIRQDYIRKQHLILKKLIEIAGQSSESSSNIFLFIYPFTLQQKDISYFCHVYCDFVTNLAEDNIINFFKAVTKSAISKQLVFLVFKMSQLLKNEEEFFKLRMIYQKYILPILTRRAKACNKVEESVYQVCSFYILGFLKHCDIGKEGINCIIYNIDQVKNQSIQDKWIQICGLICHQYHELKPLIIKNLRLKIKKDIEFNSELFRNQLQNEQVFWNISIRSGRKHKKYPKVVSRLKGIQNKHNDCYMISTVQALEKTAILSAMLDKYRDQIKTRLPLLDELRILFGQMSGRRKADIIRVSYLKKRGPQYFTESIQQEDVQQYILELFSSIEAECNQIGLLDQFKDIFQINTINTVTCDNCDRSIQTQQKQYIYTIPHTQVLQEISEQQSIADYECQNCHQKCSKLKKQLRPNSKIIIVHINRFSHQKGKAYKQLSTQIILRKFLKYELIGMICHIGKNVEHGHYIYYGRVSQKRWAIFNDRYVEQFELSKEDEEFERQMKAQMTPYILFYRKKEE